MGGCAVTEVQKTTKRSDSGDTQRAWGTRAPAVTGGVRTGSGGGALGWAPAPRAATGREHSEASVGQGGPAQHAWQVRQGGENPVGLEKLGLKPRAWKMRHLHVRLPSTGLLGYLFLMLWLVAEAWLSIQVREKGI